MPENRKPSSPGMYHFWSGGKGEADVEEILSIYERPAAATRAFLRIFQRRELWKSMSSPTGLREIEFEQQKNREGARFLRALVRLQNGGRIY